MQPEGFDIYIEKIPGKGEDAPPLCLWHEERQMGLLAVFDGMGGAGSASVGWQGGVYSGAYVAARLVCNFIAAFFQAYQQDQEAFAEHLQAPLAAYLQMQAEQLYVSASKLRSRLIRRLPTTMAAVLYTYDASCQEWKLTVCWAGDSRVYALMPEKMLLLTRDDTQQPVDLLCSLHEDPPLGNCLHAEGSFYIHSYTIRLPGPVCLLAATDGCFAYLPSPMHFDFLLRVSLQAAGACSLSAWAEQLYQRLLPIAGDDASMAAVLLQKAQAQYDRLSCLADFTALLPKLYREYIQPIDLSTAQLHMLQEHRQHVDFQLQLLQDQQYALRQQLWQQYQEAGYIEQKSCKKTIS